MLPIIRLPRGLQLSLEATSRALLQSPDGRTVDFSSPMGEEALVAPDSVSWRIFKNPIALLVGGMAAVILELAEPAVRTGVWRYSSFRSDPLRRLRRTGLAAMVTVYGARSVAEPMIEGIVRMHDRVQGKTPAGEAFAANDPKLLRWVHATATYGFSEAYSRYVARLGERDFDALYCEGGPASRLYGAANVPRSMGELNALFDSMRSRLEPSEIVFEFLQIMRATTAFPPGLRWLQPMLVRASIDLIPPWIRERLGLHDSQGLRAGERMVVRMAGALADKIVLSDSPPSQACRRLGLSNVFLYAPAYNGEPVKALGGRR